MANNNGIITAPVTIEDIQAVLGVSSTDAWTLCHSFNKINMWAKYKPCRLWRTPAVNEKELDDNIDTNTKQMISAGNQRRNNTFGLCVPFSDDAGVATGPGVLGRLAACLVDEDPFYESIDWGLSGDHNGGLNSYYDNVPRANDIGRLTDFNGYDHNAMPINTPYGVWPYDYDTMDMQMVNPIAKKIEIGINWPTNNNSITWNELLSCFNNDNKPWYFCVEVYASGGGMGSAQSQKFGFRNATNSSVSVAPVAIYKATTPVNTSGMPQTAQMTVSIPLEGNNALAVGNYTLVWGFATFSGSTNYKGILVPWCPIKRIRVDAGFPLNMKYWKVSPNGTTWHASDSATATGGFRVAQSNFWVAFEVTNSLGNITLYNTNHASGNLKCKAVGQHGTTEGTVTIVNATGAAINQQTLSSGSTSYVYLRLDNVLKVGEQSQFIIYYKNGVTWTEMATANVNVTRTS